MAKARDWPLTQDAVARSTGSLNTARTRWGAVFKKWPRKRGKATSGYDFYKQTEFALVASWAANPEPIAYQTAIELAKGTDLVPRDMLMRASYGTLYTIIRPDGTEIPSYRMVAPNAQLILDQVTDTIGAMLYRAPIGWVEVAPGNNGQVLAMLDLEPQWQDVYPVAIADATFAIATPDAALPNALIMTSTDSIIVNTALPNTVNWKRAAITGDVEIAEDANDAVIPDGTVTYAKMQQTASDDVLLGRAGGGAGEITEVTKATVVSWIPPTGGGTPIVPFFKDSNIYLTAPSAAGSALSTFVATANRIYYIPICVPWERAFTTIAVGIPTGGNVAGSNVRLGIFDIDQSTGGPNDVLVDAGNVSTATTGLKTITISATLAPGQYYLAVWCSAAITLRAINQSFGIAQNSWLLGAATPAPSNQLTEVATFGSAFSNASGATQTTNTGGVAQILAGIR